MLEAFQVFAATRPSRRRLIMRLLCGRLCGYYAAGAELAMSFVLAVDLPWNMRS
jgi:hypothetical protein